MNSPVVYPTVVPRPGAAVFYETARWIGFQTVTGFAIFSLYLIHAIGHELASILIWTCAVGVLGLRQVLWAVARKLDYYAYMPTRSFDWFARFVALPLVVLGFAVNFQWL